MRYVLAALALVIVVGGLAAVKATQISTLVGMGQAMAKAGPPPEVVGTTFAETRSWEGSLDAVGTVASVKGVAISNDAPGLVSRIHFDSGAIVKEGDVLVELDTSVERAEVLSAQAQRELASRNARRTRSLVSSGVLPEAQLDQDESQLKSAAAAVELSQAQIRRKTIRAPFAGRLGIRAVNVGQYLSSGTPITVLEAVEGAYVDFTLPQQENVSVGMPVRISIEGAPDLETHGVIVAKDPTVDATTRTLKLRASVPDEAKKLRPGMFANVSVILPSESTVVTIPATAIVHASYGDSVFVVEAPPDQSGATGSSGKDSPRVARQQFVRTGERRGDFVAVVEGVKSGEEVVTSGAFKLRNKSRVVVNDEVVAKPELSPKPENH